VSCQAVTLTTRTALETLLDVEVMTARLAAMLPSPALILETATLVDHKPGHRALVHYRGSQSGRAFSAYGKAYPDRAGAARVHDLMRRLRDEVFAGARGLRVPQPLGLDPELALVVYAPVIGIPLDRPASTPDFSVALDRAARWLATLHRSRLQLDRTLDVMHETTNALTWAGLVAARHPSTGAVAARLTDALQTTRPPSVDTARPIHKDFHYGHVIVGDDAVGVVDFDELRMGDPDFDVAHFAANLHLLSVRTGAPPIERDRWLDCFLGAYSDATGWKPGRGFDWFAGYTCVKIAKQVATGRGPQPRPGGDARTAQIDVILRKGLAWLAR
jgi:phosphotransferase family enzyme